MILNQNNMKNIHLLLSLNFVLLLFSCAKDDPPIVYDSITAGSWDSNFEYSQFPTPIEFQAVWEANNWVANADTNFYIPFGQDSIPFRFQIKYINYDSLQSINNKDSSIFQILQVYAFDNMGFHLTKKSYYAGLGTAADFYTLTAYKSGDMILGNRDEFSFSSNNYHRWKPLWEMPIPMHGPLSGYDGGQWYSLTTIRYMGFMYKNHLGWFKVDCTDHNHPKIISCALKK